MKRKYVSYILVAEDGQVDMSYSNYYEANRDYWKEVRYGHPATLYGVNIFEEMEVIFSHE